MDEWLKLAGKSNGKRRNWINWMKVVGNNQVDIMAKVSKQLN